MASSSVLYHKKFAIFTFVMVLVMVAFQLGLPSYYISSAWVVFGLIALTYWLTGLISFRYLGTENFGNAIMATKGLRMLVVAAGFFAYVYLKGADVMTLAAVLLISYLSYSVFEIRALLPNLHNQSEN